MTQIDFYVLKAGASGDRFQLACRIAEKARRSGRRVLIHTGVESEAKHLDTLLWTLSESSFIPHARLDTGHRELNPILIGDGHQDVEEHDILINLENGVPAFFGRFQRLIECVDHQEERRTASRERFRYYREHGYPMQTHEIS